MNSKTLLTGVAKNICPKCQRGKVFHGLYKMNTSCPECGLVFERESGYFVGAMSFSYIIGFIGILPLFLWLLFNDYSLPYLVILPGIQIILMSPFVFRYSRLIWIYMDRKAEP